MKGENDKSSIQMTEIWMAPSVNKIRMILNTDAKKSRGDQEKIRTKKLNFKCHEELFVV